ncbi:MAG: PUA domain-containing protein [Nitrososphaerota archaeon]
MQFHRLSKRDAKKLAEMVNAAGLSVSGESAAVMVNDDVRIYEIGGSIVIESQGAYIPLVDELVNKELLEGLPLVIVDMGAVRRLVNGADVMRPGIVSFEGEFKQGDLVVVRDVNNRRALAVCRALMDSKTAAATQRGKVLENLHYVGDKYWRLSRRLIELSR